MISEDKLKSRQCWRGSRRPCKPDTCVQDTLDPRGQPLDGKRAGKMASANVDAREILEGSAALVSDSLQLSHDDRL